MPGRPFQGVRIRLAGSALRALLGASAERLIRPDALNLLRASNRTRPPPKKNNRPAAPVWKTDRLPSAQGSGSKRAHALFSHPPDAQKRVCGGIAARSRRCGGAASQLYDQFRPHFAINRLRRKRHKPQRGSPNRRTGRGIFPAAPFAPIIARRGAREHSLRFGPPRLAPARPFLKIVPQKSPEPGKPKLKRERNGRPGFVASKRPNSQTPAAQGCARVSEA